MAIPSKALLLTAVSISLLPFCAGGSFAGTSRLPVTHVRGDAHRVISALPGAVTLYDQNSDDSGIAIISSHFSDFLEFTSSGAEDFVVPAGHKWKIQQVEVAGIYAKASGGSAGPADSENVFFYRDRHGLPGELVAECDNIKGKDNLGSFAIKLPKSCKVVLHGGRRYWVSVAANINFSCCGEWTWETRNNQNGDPAAWENPNDGFHTNCLTWRVMTSCIEVEGEGPDFMFTLKGKDILLGDRF